MNWGTDWANAVGLRVDMIKLKNFCHSYWHDDSGATAIEYALIAVVIAISIIAGASTIGKNNDSLWNGVTTAIQNAG